MQIEELNAIINHFKNEEFYLRNLDHENIIKIFESKFNQSIVLTGYLKDLNIN